MRWLILGLFWKDKMNNNKSEQMTLLEYKDGADLIKLIKEKPENGDIPLPSPYSLFTLKHSLSNETPLKGLRFIEAMSLWVVLLAEVVEKNTKINGDFAYSKEQFMAMANLQVQQEVEKLNSDLSSTLTKENLNFNY